MQRRREHRRTDCGACAERAGGERRERAVETAEARVEVRAGHAREPFDAARERRAAERKRRRAPRRKRDAREQHEARQRAGREGGLREAAECAAQRVGGEVEGLWCVGGFCVADSAYVGRGRRAQRHPDPRRNQTRRRIHRESHVAEPTRERRAQPGARAGREQRQGDRGCGIVGEREGRERGERAVETRETIVDLDERRAAEQRADIGRRCADQRRADEPRVAERERREHARAGARVALQHDLAQAAQKRMQRRGKPGGSGIRVSGSGRGSQHGGRAARRGGDRERGGTRRSQ